MAEPIIVTIRAEFTNRKAMRAFARAYDLTCEIAESQPWNEEAKEAMRAMRYALKHFKMDIQTNA